MASASSSPGVRSGGRRREPKDLRRRQLIEATIDTLAARGYAATTLMDVAQAAGLSRGIVNFHFATKENLLAATLRHLADEYAANWRDRLARAGPETAARIEALVLADLDKSICTPRKLAAWFALLAETGSRPQLRRLAWDRDAAYRGALGGLCRQAAAEAGYAYPAEALALAIYAMQEGLWLRLMLSPRKYGRPTALRVARSLLATVFPRHFAPDGKPRR